MALPEDVTTFTLNFGAYYDASGQPAFGGMTGKIRPSRSPILHTDGSVLVNEAVPVTIDDFGTASVDLVHTNHGGGFTYSVVWDVASRKPSPGNLSAFSVTVEDGAEVDFDDLAESDDVEGVFVPRGATGPQGPQGAPGVADDASVAALIPGPGATATALRAASVTPVGSTTTPITNPATARPTGAAVVYWICAAGVTPTNAVNGDLIWNA